MKKTTLPERLNKLGWVGGGLYGWKYTLYSCPFSDDQVFGIGGTLAKYSSEGKNIISLILLYGEKSEPWLKEDYLIKARVKESQTVDQYLRIKKTFFLGIKEKDYKSLNDEKVKQKIKNIILKYKPVKIFTHAPDLHLEHRLVNKIVLEIFDELKLDSSLYTFSIWSLVDVNKNFPRLYVDITKTFDKKIKAIKKFKSQWESIFLLLPVAHLKARLNGLKNNCKYAELFHKIR